MHTTFAPTSDTAAASEFVPLQGVALVIHGLNVNPARMQPLVDVLRGHGIAVVLCTLRGHGENYSPLADCADDVARLRAFHQVRYADWQAEVATAYQQAATYARPTAAPIFLVAFSLGALLGCDLLAAVTDVHFARMILLAPALALHPYCHLPALLSRWPHLSIRSRAPSVYRANPVTPIAAYQALYTALRHVQRQPTPALNCPALVLIDPADELVSVQGIGRFIHQHGLTHWRIQLIHKAAATSFQPFHHLILDSASVGLLVWQGMVEQIIRHLIGKPAYTADDQA